MKKHFKLIFAALSALLLFVSSTFTVSATGSDKLPGGTDDDIKEEDFAYHGSVTGKNSDGTYYIYHLYSDNPICFYYHEQWIRMPHPSGYYKTTSYTKLNIADEAPTLVKSNTFIENKAMIYGDYSEFFRYPYYETFTATVPIFENAVDAKEYLETGDDSKCTNPEYRDFASDKEWNYSGTIKATDSTTNAEDMSYSLCSDGRLAILNEEEYTYQLYTGTGSKIYEDTGNGLVNLSLDGVLWYNLFPMARYNSYKSTIPIFTSREKLLNYIETGDLDGCINGANLPQDTSLPYLQNVTWTSVPDCYGGIPYIMGDKISWLVEDKEWTESGKVELQIDVKVRMSVVGSSLPAGAASAQLLDQYFNVPLTSSELSEMGLGFIDYSTGMVIIPDDKIETLVQSKIDNSYGSNRFKYVSHERLYFYVRLSWLDSSQGKMLYSGWTRITPGGSINNFGHIVTGTITGTVGGQFSFETDLDSDSSYEYNKDFAGNYPFDEDTTKVPTSIDEALSSFVDIIGALIKSMGKVPALVKTVFGFLPNVFFVLIGCSFTVVVILRILGR